MWLTLCIPGSSFADETAAAVRWLQASERAAAASNASGVYGAYSLARIALEQARVFALLGDVSSTEARLPDLKRSRPEWTSDGGGMVRMMSFMHEAQEVQRSLLRTLANNGRVSEAFDYTRVQLAGLSHDQGWQWLGHALAGRIAPADERIDALDPSARRRFDLGMLRAALARSDNATIRALLTRWPNGSARAKAISSLTVDLMLDNETASIQTLLRIAVSDDPDAIELLALAASSALQNKDFNTAMRYTARMPFGRKRDELEAIIAFSLLQADRRDDAVRLFDGANQHTAKRWEQVALGLDRFEWLQAYYQTVRDPWRRAERFYQLARHALGAGDKVRAVRLAETAEEISGSIKTASTRWIVRAAAAAIYAATGDVTRATRIAEQIPRNNRQGARHHAKAIGAIALAWAGSGDANKAIAIANRIADPAARAVVLAKAATSAKQRANRSYAMLVEASRQACSEVPGTAGKARNTAWTTLINQQLRAHDTTGARESASAAQKAGVGPAAWEVLIGYYLTNKDFKAAQHAAQSIPSEVDPKVGYDRRARAQVEIIEAMADAGRAREAIALLAALEQKYHRERGIAAIAEGLASGGEPAEALHFLGRLKRDDLREVGFLTVLRAMLEEAQLPDPRSVMSLVPERRGAALCWIVAAATAHAKLGAEVDIWLAALPGPLCKSFAYAGAAWSVTVPPEAINVHRLLDRFDPRKTMQRLEKIMRAQRGG